MSTVVSKVELLAGLPALADTTAIRQRILEIVASSGRKVVVLDDDPTGSQTVHGIKVLTGWDVKILEEALTSPENVFYILTNSRALDVDQARALNREIAVNLCQASRSSGVGFDIVSRSDSTLRGHYPLELDVLEETLNTEMGTSFAGHLLVPAFFEGGRYTIGNIHYVQNGAELIPAAETEFAKDAVFGYSHSDMAQYIEEKTAGRCPAAAVVAIGIDDLRTGGAERVANILLQAETGSRIFVNAADYADLDVFVLGLLQAEQAGRRYLVRSSASFVKVRGAVVDKPYLTRDEVAPAEGLNNGGLVVVGSYVGKTGRQINYAKNIDNLDILEVRVEKLLEEDSRRKEIARVLGEVEAALTRGTDIMIYTSRTLIKTEDKRANLDIGQKVSSALVEIVQRLTVKPRFLIAKGGITSSDLATEALGVKSALVIGQVAPGISAWQLQAEAKFPGMAYIVFPGNVGTDQTLAEVIRLLSGELSVIA